MEAPEQPPGGLTPGPPAARSPRAAGAPAEQLPGESAESTPDVSFGGELVALCAKLDGGAAGSRESGRWDRPDPELFWRERFQQWGLAWPTGEPMSPRGDSAIRARLEDFIRRARTSDASELDALLAADDEDGGGAPTRDFFSDSDSPTHLCIGSGGSFCSAGDDAQSDGDDFSQAGSRATVALDERRLQQLRQAMAQELQMPAASGPRVDPAALGGAGGGLPPWLLGTWYAVEHPSLPAGATAKYRRDGSFEGYQDTRGRVLRIQPSQRGSWLEVLVEHDPQPQPDATFAVRQAPRSRPPGCVLTCHSLLGAPPARFPDEPGQYGDLVVGLWRPARMPAESAIGSPCVPLQGSPQRRRCGVDHGAPPPALDKHSDWLLHPTTGLALLPRGAWGGRLDRPDGLVVALHAVPCSVPGRWGLRRPRRLVVTSRDVLLCSTLKGSTNIEVAVPVTAVTQVWIVSHRGESFCDLTLHADGRSSDICIRAEKQKAGALAASLRKLQQHATGSCPPGQQRRMIAAFIFAAARRRELVVASHVALISGYLHRELKVRVVPDDSKVPPARHTGGSPPRLHFPWDLPVMTWNEVAAVLPTEAAIRFRLDAFYRTYTGQSTVSFGPADAAKVDVLVAHVLEGRHPLDRVLEKMSEKHEAPSAEWQGRLPVGLVRFHLLAVCRHHDPAAKGVQPLLPKGRVARAHVIDHLARRVCSGEFSLEDVVQRLCNLWGVPADQWLGEYPEALRREGDDASASDMGLAAVGLSEDGLRFLIDAFYLTISPGDIGKAEGLCDHVTSGRHPLRRVVAVMCEKYAANPADWNGPNPPGPLRYRLDCLIARHDPLYEGVEGRYGPGLEARANFVEGLVQRICDGELRLVDAVREVCGFWNECEVDPWLGQYPEALRARGQ